jgi:hypothetical protein
MLARAREEERATLLHDHAKPNTLAFNACIVSAAGDNRCAFDEHASSLRHDALRRCSCSLNLRANKLQVPTLAPSALVTSRCGQKRHDGGTRAGVIRIETAIESIP